MVFKMKPHDIIEKIRVLLSELTSKKHTGKVNIELNFSQGSIGDGRVVKEERL